MRTYQQFREEMDNEKNHVHGFMDYMPDTGKKPTRKEIQNFAHKHGGKSIKIKSIDHDGPGGGASEVVMKGHVKHIMKLHNHVHDDNYPLNHDGHKKMESDYA